MASSGVNDGYYCNDLVYDENDYIDACEDGGGVYNLENCSCYDGPIEGPSGGGGGGGSVSPANQTPIITGIAPDVWQPGTTTQVTITGEYFGANMPNLLLSPSGGISYSIAPGSYGDTQIVAQISVASGTPNEDVAVTVVNNGYWIPFYSGGGVTSPDSAPAYASVLSNMTTNQIAIIGWINGNAPDILATLSTGPSTVALTNALNGGPISCNALQFSWLLQNRADLNTAQDQAYANAWEIHWASSPTPPATINPATMLAAPTTWKVFSEFGNGTGAWQAGSTENPCGGAAVNWYTPSGQASQYMGEVGATAAGNIYSVAECRIGPAPQLIVNTLNCNASLSTITTCTPWIYDVAEFNGSTGAIANVLDPANYAPFPMYYIYLNGQIYAQSVQEPLASFVSLSASDQLVPPPAN